MSPSPCPPSPCPPSPCPPSPPVRASRTSGRRRPPLCRNYWRAHGGWPSRTGRHGGGRPP
ncbi:hypothetical protein DVH02_34280 [Streptomyces corynorhini]|uniref:Uncharacterized protein n=1 Tax=Streptomyces corynorhini TaxID=2282652 RepID=A0A370AQG7_9ACTN|nr:hypothetical protein DVH02_34280 [Streptomyces corynorhini]